MDGKNRTQEERLDYLVEEFKADSGEYFEGVSVAPEYQHRFEKLANEAIYYYNN